MEIIKLEKKEMIPLNHEENNIYNEQKICHKCEEKFCTDKDNKDYIHRKKVKNNCHYTGKIRGAAHIICNLKYKVPKEIPIINDNASHDTHFMLNQLAIEFQCELNCIGDNMEIYKCCKSRSYITITETNLYVPVVTLPTQDNSKLLPQLKNGFKRTISWNKYLAKPEILARNANLNHLIEPSFLEINVF